MSTYDGPAATPALMRELRRIASFGLVHLRQACRFLFLVVMAASLFSAVAATPSPIHGQERSQAEIRAQAEELRRLALEHARLSRAQAEEMRALAQEQAVAVRAHAEELGRLALEQAEVSRAQAALIRAQSEETRRLALEQALEMRLRADEMRLRAQEQAREMQQVVTRTRARVRLGVELDPDQGPEYDRQGVRVKGLVTGSPAEAAGLRKDDIVTHINGRSLLEPLPDPDREARLNREGSLPVQRLLALAGDLERGEEVEVRLVRDGRNETATFAVEHLGGRGGVAIFPREGGRGEEWLYFPEIRLDTLRLREGIVRIPELRFDSLLGGVLPFDTEFPFDTAWVRALRVRPDLHDLRLRLDTLGAGAWGGFAFGDSQEPFVGLLRAGRFRGLELRDLNPDLAPYFSTDRGVLVLDVDQDRELGLRPGDVILAIGDREVENVRDVRRILSSYREEERVTFQVMRQGRPVRVEGRMDR